MEFKEDAMRRPVLIAVSCSIAAISVLMLIALGIILPSLFRVFTGWLPRMIVLLALCTATAGAFLGALVLSIIIWMLLVFEVRRKLHERESTAASTPDDGPFGGRWAKYAPGASSDEDDDEEDDDIAPPAFVPKSRRPRDAAATLLFAALIVLLAGVGLVVASAATLIVFSAPLL